jgi:hypothetical protein
MSDETEVRVHGTTLVGFAQACVNLSIVAGRETRDLIAELDMNRWYPFARLVELERVVLRAYQDTGPILTKVGMVMMHNWFHHGPGQSLIRGGASFLHFQTGSQGYASVVQGPVAQVGSFELELFDRRKGFAVIRSTTPFDKRLERGVLLGGMRAPGDLDYVDVYQGDEPSLLYCEFH